MLLRIRSKKWGSQRRVIGGIIFALTLSACLKPAASVGLQNATSPATTTSDTTTTVTGDVYLSIDTAWEMNDTVYENHGSCAIDTGSGLTSKTCTIRIPEGQLHFSKTKFTWGTTNSTVCHRVVFRPAYFRASDEVAFTPYVGDSPAVIDCSAATSPTTVNKTCFHGAGTLLYSDWPETLGEYFNTSFRLEASSILDSSNALSSLGNTLVANMIDDDTMDVDDAGGDPVYIGNSMNTYIVQCRDKYDQLQRQVNVYVADEDLETGEDPADANNDTQYDWEQTL